MGNNFYINKYIFRLLESDDIQENIWDNPEVFKDSDMNFIYDRIHAVV